MLFIAFKGNSLSKSLKNRMFYLGNLTILIMMVVAIYTHLHPNVPAEVLAMEFKPPVMSISYIVLVFLNIFLHKKNIINEHPN